MRSASILRFRAIVKIHVATDAREASNICALVQTVTMTSWAHSSARDASAPDLIKNPFTRGAKWS